jgi:hypothetical protein
MGVTEQVSLIHQMQGGEERTNQGGHDWPKIIVCPAEPNDNKELPLIPTHSNLLDL